MSIDDTIVFCAEVYPKNATMPQITWSTTDPEIAIIDSDGVLTALKAGSVTVVATSADGFQAVYEVTVRAPASGAVGLAGILGVGVASAVGIIKLRKKK